MRSVEMLDEYIRLAAGWDGAEPLAIHLEIDTGMHRTGLLLDEAAPALRRLAESDLRLAGLMTHLACADEPEQDDITRRQLADFDSVVATAQQFGFEDFIVHAAASAGGIRFPEARYGMVRIGLALLGIHPSPATRPLADLRPVVRLVSKIVEITEVDAGQVVGYGATFRTTGPTRVGVVPAGYHDCVPRSFSNSGKVEVLGREAPVLGRVSMDSMMIDLSQCPEAEVGTDVTIYGGGVSIEEAAERADTIPYELLARVGPRVQRILMAHGASSRPQ